jgi:hypothetical protein
MPYLLQKAMVRVGQELVGFFGKGSTVSEQVLALTMWCTLAEKAAGLILLDRFDLFQDSITLPELWGVFVVTTVTDLGTESLRWYQISRFILFCVWFCRCRASGQHSAEMLTDEMLHLLLNIVRADVNPLLSVMALIAIEKFAATGLSCRYIAFERSRYVILGDV